MNRHRPKKGTGGEITTYGDKSRKSLLAVTLVTVLSIISVITVYAVFIGSFTGGEVTVGGTAGSVRYSFVNADPWTEAISPANNSVTWYSRVEIAGGYSGPVNMTWFLQQKTGSSTWANVTGATVSTLMVLTGGAEYVYATGNGAITGNHDWSPNVAGGGTYRVYVSVESA